MFKTKDLYVATTLFNQGCILSKTDRVGKECHFIFEDKEKCERVSEEYLSGKLKVNPRLIFNDLKDMKNIIYNNY